MVLNHKQLFKITKDYNGLDSGLFGDTAAFMAQILKTDPGKKWSVLQWPMYSVQCAVCSAVCSVDVCTVHCAIFQCVVWSDVMYTGQCAVRMYLLCIVSY